MLYFKGIFYSTSLLLGVGLTYWIMMSKEFNDPPSKICDPSEEVKLIARDSTLTNLPNKIFIKGLMILCETI